MDNNGNGNIPTWVNIRVKLGDLKPWALNPRHITKKQAERLAASFDSFGQVETIAVSPSLDVYNGHQRLSVLHKLHGPNYEIDARQASRPLTDDERRKLVIYLHAGAVGGWDWDSLSSWPSDSLMQWGFDGDLLGDWKKDIAALGNLLESEAPEPADAEPQIDRAEELNKKWQVKTGDLWRIGEHRLLCGDSTKREDAEKVMQGEKPDLVIADPPYGVNIVAANGYVGGGEAYNIPFGGVKNRRLGSVGAAKPFGSKAVRGSVGAAHMVDVGKYAPIVGDDTTETAIKASAFYLEQFPDAAQVWWGANYYANSLEPSACWLVWDKETTGNFADCELAWVNQDKAAKLFRHKWNGMLRDSERERRWHPTQKPAALAAWVFLEFTNVGAIVLDPFAGAGWTIIGAEQSRRKARAIEISAEYISVILERMSTAFPGIEIERLESSNASPETCNEQAAN